MDNNQDCCDYSLSLALKAAGFDEPCDHYYEATHWERTACFPLKRKEPKRYKAYKALVKEPPEINLREEYGITNSVFVSREDVINLTQNDGVIRRSVFASAPSLYTAQKWLREKKRLAIIVGMTRFDDWFYGIYDKCGKCLKDDGTQRDCYEAALFAGISAALELIQKGK